MTEGQISNPGIRIIGSSHIHLISLSCPLIKSLSFLPEIIEVEPPYLNSSYLTFSPTNQIFPSRNDRGRIALPQSRSLHSPLHNRHRQFRIPKRSHQYSKTISSRFWKSMPDAKFVILYVQFAVYYTITSAISSSPITASAG